MALNDYTNFETNEANLTKRVLPLSSTSTSSTATQQGGRPQGGPQLERDSSSGGVKVTQQKVEQPPKTVSSTQVPAIIGQTPFGSGLQESVNIAKNVLPILYITPCTPTFLQGISLFKLEPNWTTYRANLQQLGYSLSKDELAFTYTVDSLPSETFTNEYGATFLAKMADVVSESASDLAQMAGAKNSYEVLNSIGSGLKKFEKNKAAQYVGDKTLEVANAIQNMGNLKKGEAGNETLRYMINSASKMLAGQRIDFPSVWKNSTFSPSYSINVRLYNPYPGDTKATEQYIIAPLAAILALVCPVIDKTGDQGETFSYPLFCKIRSDGLFFLENAGITSVQITKGGAEGLVAYNNRVGLIDVRIDFINLYNTMVVGNSESERPMAKTFLENLKGAKKVETFESGSMIVGGKRALSGSDNPLAVKSNSLGYTQAEPTSAERVAEDKKASEAKIMEQIKKENSQVERYKVGQGSNYTLDTSSIPTTPGSSYFGPNV